MSVQKKNNALPPPPRPDPVTLDQIYNYLTSPDVIMEERSYHLVALSSVAFHPSVKLFLFEHTPLHPTVSIGDDTSAEGHSAEVGEVLEANRRRREAVIKSIAFFLAQRNSTVAHECRWDTVALLGELCRLENLTPLRAGGNKKNVFGTMSVLSPMREVVQKINHYARANLEFLARLPWFVPAVQELIGEEETEGAAAAVSSSSASPLTAGTAHLTIRRAERQRNASSTDDEELFGIREPDEDVRIALKDILLALPEVTHGDGAEAAVVWSPERMNQAQDLMFLDASTTILHLIPLVSRCSHLQCAHCEKRVSAAGGSDGNKDNDNNNNNALLRCGSCRAVYYCDAACQRAHWSLAHRVPCKSYKQLSEDIMSQYEAMNKRHHGGSRRKMQRQQKEAVAVLEVPLEPSLFYETRRYLYDHRDPSFAEMSFMDYFMKYDVRGS
ncbi:hypothetical protein C3747_65g58 [Trypanosoma cruzi]|uniref:MYND-type domain-containing protein n=2 Tax=Trypanosoma cruzi TaxID=5693 RepID=Q4DZV8_TRYCC|nr:hypothetical protein, conserved [Trypanosoma cruzi]EAN98079.1 hypothetical protein, conserved [Trypanosoma cruzi]PWV10822.1 hypothetical protein C3747_65g58 [Trypanosoma cruzi]|eukprot:XP_819930.1 hypothetical protein [Trypanosoma cruzi strain CL Brener]